MCLALPTPPESDHKGKPVGPLLMFFGGVAFLAIMLGSLLLERLRTLLHLA